MTLFPLLTCFMASFKNLIIQKLCALFLRYKITYVYLIYNILQMCKFAICILKIYDMIRIDRQTTDIHDFR